MRELRFFQLGKTLKLGLAVCQSSHVPRMIVVCTTLRAGIPTKGQLVALFSAIWKTVLPNGWQVKKSPSKRPGRTEMDERNR